MKHIDVRKAVKSKYKGYVPGFAFRWLEKLIHEDELNKMMELQDYVDGVSMAKKVIDYLDLTVELIGAERLPAPEERSFFVSNHPLGGADGIIITAVLGKHYDGNIKFLVNDILMAAYQFNDVFLPVNKYGKQGREHAELIGAALESDDQMITFPAGLCSRAPDGKTVCDLKWNASFIRMAQRSNRQVVPLFFEGVNTPRFYKWARLRERSGMKFSAELLLLPSELIRAKGKHFRIYVGEPIPVEDLPTGKAVHEYANELRDSLYEFPERYKGGTIEIL